ncbi:MAG TPA: acetoin utilization protein AcuC [Chloroflexota bacterium]|nr:acetoin utilization protein AcuC [Chloroflexota bacterium]
MSRAPAGLVYAPDLAESQLRPDHPLKPARARDCYRLLEGAGALGGGGIEVLGPPAADVQEVLRVHTPDYVEVVRALSAPPPGRALRPDAGARYGLSEHGDTPPYPGMFEYGLRVCGASLESARLVQSGAYRLAFNPAGGVNHHAMASRASGFGIFNDAAVAIAWLLEQGQRVMYVDLDVHHGDGVEAAFEDDQRVLTVSLHESTRYLFPGPKGGAATDTGRGRGAGYSVNLPFEPYTGDEAWLWGFEEIVPPLYQAFAPDVLLVQLGADGYFSDPLAHLLLTTRAYETAARRLRALTDGRLVAVGGGGYDVEATPRIWALELVTLAGLDLPPRFATALAAWRDPPGSGPEVPAEIQRRTRAGAEEAVATVKRLVFPVHGLA